MRDIKCTQKGIIRCTAVEYIYKERKMIKAQTNNQQARM
jgi:hypothetical protein